jgi:hypothetical protein
MKCCGEEVNILRVVPGYCVRVGHSVQGYRFNSAWSCTVGRILCEGRA